MVYDTSPRWSPDGSHIIFYTYRHDKIRAELYKVKPDGSGLTRLTNTSYNEWWSDYSPDGKKIYITSDKNRAKPFAGGEIFVLDVQTKKINQLTQNKDTTTFNILPRVSPNGQQILYSYDFIGPRKNAEIYLMNKDGSGNTNLTNHPAIDRFGSWSPDGKKILFQSNRDGDHEIYVMDANGKNLIQLTHNKTSDSDADWSSNNEIVFVSNRDGDREIFVMNADGSNQRQLTFNNANDVLPSWSPDGKKIAFTTYRHGKQDKGDIYIINKDGSGEKRLTPR